MKTTPLLGLVLLLTISAACSGARRPHRLSGAGVSPAVLGVLELPTAPGPHSAVILLPGSYGWRADYADFARTFADSGFVALALDYYGETGRGSTPAAERRNWPAWIATVRNAVTYLDTLPAVSGRPIGLVGYSRGAFLAISAAASTPAVKAVVDYYGGGSDEDPPEAGIPTFPPVLILHGDADSEIPVSLGQRLFERIQAHGGTVEMHVYPGAGHAFNGPWASTYSPAAAADAWQRTIRFLREHLSTDR